MADTQDTLADAQQDTSLFASAMNHVGDNLYFRFGGGYLDYFGSSSNLKVENAKGLAAQAFGPGGSEIADSGSSLKSKMFPSGTIGLYLPYTTITWRPKSSYRHRSSWIFRSVGLRPRNRSPRMP